MEPVFEEFVAVRGESLLRLALMLSGDPHRAEDLVQSVLAKAYVRWGHIAAMGRPEAYLRRVLVNEHLRWWRR
jgi:DNA-directed RNA polymerase specialized sigma24 family protein